MQIHSSIRGTGGMGGMARSTLGTINSSTQDTTRSSTPATTRSSIPATVLSRTRGTTRSSIRDISDVGREVPAVLCRPGVESQPMSGTRSQLRRLTPSAEQRPSMKPKKTMETIRSRMAGHGHRPTSNISKPDRPTLECANLSADNDQLPIRPVSTRVTGGSSPPSDTFRDAAWTGSSARPRHPDLRRGSPSWPTRLQTAARSRRLNGGSSRESNS